MSDFTPLVSVVIPLYNYGKYIEKCVQSVLDQSHKNIQIIVINNASTDDGPKRILKFTDSRLEIHHIDVNEGIGKALNLGFEKARGEWVAYLPADDYWNPDLAQKLLGAVQGKDIGLVGCWLRMIDAEGEIHDEAAKIYETANNHSEFNLSDYQQFRWVNPIAPNTFLWRRDIVSQCIPLQENLIPCDWGMLIRAARTGCKIQIVAEKLLNCRWHGENLGSTMDHSEYLLDYFYVHLTDYRETARAISSNADQEINECHQTFITLVFKHFDDPELISSLIMASEKGCNVSLKWPTASEFKFWIKNEARGELRFSTLSCLSRLRLTYQADLKKSVSRSERLRDELDRAKKTILKLKTKLNKTDPNNLIEKKTSRIRKLLRRNNSDREN